MSKKKLFNFAKKAANQKQTSQLVMAEKFHTQEMSASEVTKGRLNGWKEGTTVERPTHG